MSTTSASPSSVLALVAWVAVGLLLPVVLFRTQLGRPRAVRVGAPASSREGEPRRNVRAKGDLMRVPADDVRTLFDVLRRGRDRTPAKKIIGYREVVRIIEEEKEVTKVVGGVEKKEIKKW
ncbi:long-chain fatty acid-CoA ligase, partial [Cladochytrium tenue]